MSNRYVFPRSRRVLAPAGGFPAPGRALSLRMSINREHNRPSLYLQRSFATKDLTPFFCSSGKAALFYLFSFLREKKALETVALSAYTCPDIALAAKRAGMKILPLDIDPNLLDLSDSAPSVVAEARAKVLLLSNLYGLPNSIAPWQSLLNSGLLCIDDACQSVLSASNEGRVGFREGVIGITSFGRGKACSGVGGGAIFLSGKVKAQLSELEPYLLSRTGLSNDLITETIDFLKLLLFWVLERPAAYRIPASIPWLGLGETHLDPDFAVGPLNLLRLAAGLATLSGQAVEERTKVLTQNAALWSQHLAALPLRLPYALALNTDKIDHAQIAPIRFPIILPDEQSRDAVLEALQRAGLGATQSYPKSLKHYGELSSAIIDSPTPGADEVAKTLITLPQHAYVTPQSIEITTKIIQQVLGTRKG